MIKYTFEIFGKDFPDWDLYSYDIGNEAFINGGEKLRHRRISKRMQTYGDDFYIQNDFIYERKYAPANCKFYLNDFNEYMPAKSQNI